MSFSPCPFCGSTAECIHLVAVIVIPGKAAPIPVRIECDGLAAAQRRAVGIAMEVEQRIERENQSKGGN